MLRAIEKPRFKFNRAIEKFYGGSLIVGCGSKPHGRHGSIFDYWDDYWLGKHHNLHANQRQFYSVDLNTDSWFGDMQPDLECDVNHCPASLDKRFDFIWLECLTKNVYLAESKDEIIFANSRMEEMMADAAVLCITGWYPSRHKYQIKGQIYDLHQDNLCIYVKGPENVSPALILKSLDTDALKLLETYKLDIKDINQEVYDEKANQNFIKNKSLQLISRRISELESNIDERRDQPSLLNSQTFMNKNARLLGLKKLHQQISDKNPLINLIELIEVTCILHPQLLSGIVHHPTKDLLNRIIEMESFHLECCKLSKIKSLCTI